MMPARFCEEQEPVRVVHVGGRLYIYLCLNMSEGDDVYEDGEKSIPYHYYEYDYAELNVAEGEIDLDDLAANPENYLDYRTPQPKTAEERIADLEEQNAALLESNQMLTECVLEMSEVLYA